MSFSDYWNLAKGAFGYRPDQKVGKDLGRYLGQLGSEYIPIPGVNGSQFGEWVGSFLPFKNGGMVNHPLSYSNILAQMASDPMSPVPPMDAYQRGGKVRRRK